MTFRLAAFSSTLLLLATTGFAGEQTVDLSVPGMTCASCPFLVQAAIGAVDGVRSVAADAGTRTARVVFDDAVTAADAILAASAGAGYAATVIAPGS